MDQAILPYAGEIPGEWRFLNDWPETVFRPKDRLYFRPDPERPVAKQRNSRKYNSK